MKKNKPTISRRGFSLGGGAFTLAFLVGDGFIKLTPAEASARNVPFQSLNENQAALIDLLGEALVPGAKAAGLSHYIDHQLSAKEGDNLLILRYLRVTPPFNSFYSSSLRAVETAITQKYNKKPADLSEAQMADFITVIMQKNPSNWTQAPPAPFFYFVLRSDAIDVTYGMMDSFDSLDIPYMAHIEPAHPWIARS